MIQTDETAPAPAPHPRRKNSDDELRALLALDFEGVSRAEIARRANLSMATLTKHAERLGLRKCDTGAPDRRCRPEGGWPEDEPLLQSRVGMSPRRWRELLRRYQAGEADFDLAAEYGVSVGAIHDEAATLGMRKLDNPDSVYRTTRPEPRPAIDPTPFPAADGAEPFDDAPRPAHVLRTAQRPPDGDWRTWLFLGGRGAGKTLAGAEWLADQAELLGRGGRLALIGPTLQDVREVMIEGVSGLRSLPRWTRRTRPVYQPSRRRLYFANGCVAYAFSAEDPDSLRGPQFSAAWADEFCAWPARGPRGGAETLAMLRLGLRLPLNPSTPSGSPSPRRGEETGAPAVSSPSRSDGEGDHPEPAGRRMGEGSTARAQAASRRAASATAPRLLVTTTPKPTRALVRLRDEATCTVTHAATLENAEHLSPGFVDDLLALYGGTRREAQELEGRIVDLDGALFTAEMMLKARTPSPSPPGGEGGPEGRMRGLPDPRSPSDGQPADTVPSSVSHREPPSRSGEEGTSHDGASSSAKGARPWERTVVAIDPPATAGGDACGIVAAASRLRPDGVREAVILADRSLAGLTPDQWARRAIDLAREVGADVIVAEVNQGGDMVGHTLRAAGNPFRYRPVHATRGKRIRAEPVAALYEQGRVKHAGPFDLLEEQLMAFGGEMEADFSLDRADALVWAVTDLLVDRPDGRPGPSVRRL